MPPGASRFGPRARWVTLIWGVLLACAVLAGALLLIIFSLPFTRARGLLDPLAKDGSLELFSLAFYQAARLPALAVGLGLVGLALVGLILRKQSKEWVEWGLLVPGRVWARLIKDAPRFFADWAIFKPDRSEWLLLAALVGLALVARAAFLTRPLEHDEAYTVINFAAVPLRLGLADYHLPNNHLFHTLLVHFVFQVFGYQVWAVRLPACLAGILCVPAVYLLARRIYNRPVAAAAAGITAWLPVLVYYGTNARGYTLLMLFTLLMFLLAEYVRGHPNLLAWTGLVGVATLGFYTVPVFFYPFGVMLTWLTLSMLMGDVGPAYGGRWNLMRWLIAAGAATVLLTAALYLPVIRYSGIGTLMANTNIGAVYWDDFTQTVRSRLQDTWGQWLMGLSPWMGGLLAGGFFLSLTPLAGRMTGESQKRRVAWQAAAVLWLVSIVILQRANPWPKLWAFLIPLSWMWSAAGWLGLADWLGMHFPLRLPRGWNITGLLAGIVICAAVLGTGARLGQLAAAGGPPVDDADQVAQFLQTQVKTGDLIVVNSPHDAVVWYYSRLHGINMDHYKRELPFFRAYVLVDPLYGQTFASVMDERGPEMYFFDLTTSRVVYQSGTMQVYEVIPFADLIRKEYHIQ